MMSESVFDRLSKSVWMELQSASKVEEFYRVCKSVGTPEAIFKHIWGLPEFHNNLNIDLIKTNKNDVHAEKLMEQGNNYFEKHCYARALEIYNMCLLKSPHPPKEESATRTISGFETLSKSYRNRSSLMFELNQYEKCIFDIDRAIKFSNSNEFHQELLDRKAKCEYNISLQKENICPVNEDPTMNCFPNPNYPPTSSSTDSTLDELLKRVSLVDDVITDSQRDLGIGHTISRTRDDLIFHYSNGESINIQDHLHHPNIPCFSKALDVKFEPDCGRFIVASRDIRPGEVLLIEKAFACIGHLEPSVLRGLYTTSHCCNCLARCHSPVPCPTCHIVAFCSEECRKSKSGHQTECQILPACIALGLDEHAIQACRILGRVNFNKLIKIVPRLKQEKIKNPRLSHGCNKDGVYDSSDYRTIYNLESNIGDRDHFDIFCRSVKTFLLTIMLLESDTFFMNEAGERIFPSVKEVMTVGSTILRLLMSLPTNCYALYEYQANINNPKFDANQKNIGIGVFGTASLFNHSCNSNTGRFNCGDELIIYAKSFIPEGSEVTTSYGVSYHIDKKEERQLNLLRDYKFECKCVACSDKWPTLKDFPSETKLKTNENNELLLLQLKTILVNYYNTIKHYYLENVMDDNVETQLLKNTMIETIEFLDKYCILPCRDYFNAQKVLAQCMEKKGSLYLIAF